MQCSIKLSRFFVFQRTRTASSSNSSSSSRRRTVRIYKRHAKTKYSSQFLPEIKPATEAGSGRDKGDEKPEKEDKPKKKKKKIAGGKNGKTGNNMERKKKRNGLIRTLFPGSQKKKTPTGKKKTGGSFNKTKLRSINV